MTGDSTKPFVEQAALAWLESTVWQIRNGAEIAPGEPAAERDDYRQGAFVTTADFQGAAADVALAPGFRRIGLIHGRQLLNLVIEHWGDIPPEFRERLGLKPGLVQA